MKISDKIANKMLSVTALSKKTFKKNINYFYGVRISVSQAILSEMFIQIGYFL